MNFADHSTDPTNLDFKGDHGTSVAGIIAAVGWNGKGGRGIAPEAKLRGFNFLLNQSEPNLLNSWGEGPSAKADVFNNSWGVPSRSFPEISPDQAGALEALMRSTRAGKGGIYIKAAGNSFVDVAASDPDAATACNDAKEFILGCVPANSDMRNSLATIITVAAVNAQGVRSSYSSAGSSMWVSGFGGEYGGQKRDVPASILAIAPASYVDPAMLTTDQSGCDQGYNRNRLSNRVNALNTNASTIDSSCNYTAEFSGTSSAAPTVAGVVALMLQVNPSLSARDVKYILATTAKKNDVAQPMVTFRGLILDPGWTTNAAGHPFSNWYGYGLVDATRAVNAAKTFVGLPPLRESEWQVSTDLTIAIPYLNETQGTVSMAVIQNLKIETVQFGFYTSHKNPTNLRVTLTSPSGTKSYLQTPFSALVPVSGGWAINFAASNAFLDESAVGTWTLQIVDVKNPNDAKGTILDSWGLRFFGH